MPGKNSTWREDRIKLKQAVTMPLKAKDTMPNFWQFVNNGPGVVYVCTSPLVGETTFDIIIPAYGGRIYAKPDPMILIYLQATQDTEIYYSTLETPFDASMISQTQEVAGVYYEGLLGTIDLRNILNPLPAGGNRIGSVDVNSLPMLPTGDKTIGKVIIGQEIPSGVQHIGSVKVDEMPGWTWKRLEAAGAGDQEVKSNAGQVAYLVAEGAVVIYLKDGTTQAWKAGDYTGPVPIQSAGPISVNFGGAGVAWVLYK